MLKALDRILRKVLVQWWTKISPELKDCPGPTNKA